MKYWNKRTNEIYNKKFRDFLSHEFKGFLLDCLVASLLLAILLMSAFSITLLKSIF